MCLITLKVKAPKCITYLQQPQLTPAPGTGESGIEDNDVMDQQFDCALEGASVKK